MPRYERWQKQFLKWMFKHHNPLGKDKYTNKAFSSYRMQIEWCGLVAKFVFCSFKFSDIFIVLKLLSLLLRQTTKMTTGLKYQKNHFFGSCPSSGKEMIKEVTLEPKLKTQPRTNWRLAICHLACGNLAYRRSTKFDQNEENFLL